MFYFHYLFFKDVSIKKGEFKCISFKERENILSFLWMSFCGHGVVLIENLGGVFVACRLKYMIFLTYVTPKRQSTTVGVMRTDDVRPKVYTLYQTKPYLWTSSIHMDILGCSNSSG